MNAAIINNVSPERRTPLERTADRKAFDDALASSEIAEEAATPASPRAERSPDASPESPDAEDIAREQSLAAQEEPADDASTDDAASAPPPPPTPIPDEPTAIVVDLAIAAQAARTPTSTRTGDSITASLTKSEPRSATRPVADTGAPTSAAGPEAPASATNHDPASSELSDGDQETSSLGDVAADLVKEKTSATSESRFHAALSATFGRKEALTPALPAKVPELQSVEKPADIFEQIRVKLFPQRPEISVRLSPEELGRLDVHLAMGRDGALRANVKVERPEALRMLESDLTGLWRTLDDAGLKVTSIELHLAQDSLDTTPNGTSSHRSHEHENSAPREDQGAEDDDAVNARTVRIQRGLLDVTA